MKKYLLPILLIGFWGCEDNESDDSSATNQLVGVYDRISITINVDSNPSQTTTLEMDGSNYYATMILGEEGTYSEQGMADGEFFSTSGTWSTTGSKVTITSDESTIIFDYDYKSSEQKLTLTLEVPETADDYGGSIVYVYEKE